MFEEWQCCSKESVMRVFVQSTWWVGRCRVSCLILSLWCLQTSTQYHQHSRIFCCAQWFSLSLWNRQQAITPKTRLIHLESPLEMPSALACPCHAFALSDCGDMLPFSSTIGAMAEVHDCREFWTSGDEHAWSFYDLCYVSFSQPGWEDIMRSKTR